jgi:Ca2+-transporting ATPase
MDKIAFHAASVKEVEQFLQTSTLNGLTAEEAAARLQQHGLNVIAAEKTSGHFKIFIRQLNSPLVFLLVFAAIISVIFKEWMDAVAILIVILINTVIGFYMEYKAHTSMKELTQLSSVAAKVIRNGKLTEVNSQEVVVGDVVFAEAGDVVPADGRIFRASQLLMDESSLTGEAIPADKTPAALAQDTLLADRSNMAFKGTYVSKGNGHLLVTAIAMNTELGKIAGLVQMATHVATPLEKKLEKFTTRLIAITLLLVLIIFVAGLTNGEKWMDMLYTCIALSVAAIPEGLSIVATITLARGMLKMVKHHVIIKKLSSVETLGNTNVICTDKTGTLTQNKLKVDTLFSATEHWHEKDGKMHNSSAPFNLMLQCAVLCNTAHIDTDGKEVGDPLEIALLKFAETAGENIARLRTDFLKTAEEPFSSETKIMLTLHRHDDTFVLFAKGATEELTEKCEWILLKEGPVVFSGQIKEKWLQLAEKHAGEGQRVIAMAYRQVNEKLTVLNQHLTFLGFAGLSDPVRPEVLAAIKECQHAGIKIMMITGDHPSTAKHIGRALGIARHKELLTGKQMKDYAELTDHDKQKWLATRVFARVTPKNKLDLVQVLQENNFVVGMTGDGINDAPALKKADIGIAMGKNGTQVAQEAADMVLKDDSFSSIVVAIKQGRVILENLKKFVTFLLSCNLSELFIIALVAVMHFHFQLLPLQILFINLVTDVLPAMALGVTRGSIHIMNRPPQKADEPIINNSSWRKILFYATIISMVNIIAVLISHYYIYKNALGEPDMCNNILFFTLILSQLLHALNMGTGLIFTSDVFKNKWVWYSIVASLAALFALVQMPLVRKALNIVSMTLTEWLIIATTSVLAVIIVQGISFVRHTFFTAKKIYNSPVAEGRRKSKRVRPL